MRGYFRQCLACLVLSLTLICIDHSYCTEISSGTTSVGPEDATTGSVRVESSDDDDTPAFSFTNDQPNTMPLMKTIFNYLFGLDYPYHHFVPPKKEEEIVIPESIYSKKKVDFDLVDFSKMDDDQVNKLLYDVLLDYHPGYSTHYNSEWGLTVLTKDGQIPLKGDAIHFDIFDGYLPRGLTFNDLRVLFLYTVQPDYYLYKIKFGDMVITLRPDLENVTVHLFESYGGLMIVRLLFFIKGMFERHEYIETGRKTRLFKKMSGKSITPPLPNFPPGEDVTEEMIREWMRQRYKDVAKQNPPIVEELINYKIVFTR